MEGGISTDFYRAPVRCKVGGRAAAMRLFARLLWTLVLYYVATFLN